MWHPEFASRLDSWAELRNLAQLSDLETALTHINQWWNQSPWQPYYLHWDDQLNWPDPWQLLSDNIFCEVARGLGILYTISMINHPDIASAELVLNNDGHNLVLINGGIYILNWERDNIVNTQPANIIKRKLTQEQVKKQYN
jgi:hypothetical protein